MKIRRRRQAYRHVQLIISWSACAGPVDRKRPSRGASDGANLSVATGIRPSRPNSHLHVVYLLRIVSVIANIVLARTTVPGRIHRLVRGSKSKFDREREIAHHRQVSRNVHIAGIVILKSTFVNHQHSGAWIGI